MTLIYKCFISASKDPRSTYERLYVEIESEYPIPSNTLRRMVIDKLPLGYVTFGNLTFEAEEKVK